MREILDRDVEWLGEWIREWMGSHQPLPYLQLAESFVEQGLEQKAKAIRIWEREERLGHLRGAEALWQWVLGRTTRFGYEPLWALLWLAGLVVIGVLFVLLSNCPWGERWIARRGLWLIKVPLFVAGVVALVALMVVPGASVNARGWWSVVVVLVVGSGWAYGARPMVVRVPSHGAEMTGSAVRSVVRLIPSAVLYSVDRAVPFLSFDSEHVEWFQKPHRLNDVTFLCLYFYAHSITGFALTSLFIAGLTGILK